MPIAIYLAGASVVTLIAVAFARETRGASLESIDAADARDNLGAPRARTEVTA